MQIANVTITASDNQDVIWNAINWQEVNSQVNNLRKRIYRASSEGNMKLVSSLQKLMLRSKSNKLQAIVFNRIQQNCFLIYFRFS